MEKHRLITGCRSVCDISPMIRSSVCRSSSSEKYRSSVGYAFRRYHHHSKLRLLEPRETRPVSACRAPEVKEAVHETQYLYWYNAWQDESPSEGCYKFDSEILLFFSSHTASHSINGTVVSSSARFPPRSVFPGASYSTKHGVYDHGRGRTPRRRVQ